MNKICDRISRGSLLTTSVACCGAHSLASLDEALRTISGERNQNLREAKLESGNHVSICCFGADSNTGVCFFQASFWGDVTRQAKVLCTLAYMYGIVRAAPKVCSLN
jgi:hypothetical protein